MVLLLALDDALGKDHPKIFVSHLKDVSSAVLVTLLQILEVPDFLYSDLCPGLDPDLLVHLCPDFGLGPYLALAPDLCFVLVSETADVAATSPCPSHHKG